MEGSVLEQRRASAYRAGQLNIDGQRAWLPPSASWVRQWPLPEPAGARLSYNYAGIGHPAYAPNDSRWVSELEAGPGAHHQHPGSHLKPRRSWGRQAITYAATAASTPFPSPVPALVPVPQYYYSYPPPQPPHPQLAHLPAQFPPFLGNFYHHLLQAPSPYYPPYNLPASAPHRRYTSQSNQKKRPRKKMSSPTSPGSPTTPNAGYWQSKFAQACKECGIRVPKYELMSDRRGGRTAWSCKLVLFGSEIFARFWYSGEHTNNAQEDAAEMALQVLRSGAIRTPPTSPGSAFPTTSPGGGGASGSSSYAAPNYVNSPGGGAYPYGALRPELSHTNSFTASQTAVAAQCTPGAGGNCSTSRA